LAEIIFHHARSEDANDIKALIHLVHINPMGLDWRRFLVASSPDGELAGCAQIKPHTDGTFELASLAVHPKWRGQRIASRLIERLVLQSPRPLYLTCRSGLGGFYGKFGFRVLHSIDYPPYFRRLKRIAYVFRLRKKGESLLIMRRDE
jgi:N-acetylglutamate synthase-like GNAT family acetyltransferase